MQEPTIKQLETLDDATWAKALSLFYRENARQITDLQWTLILQKWAPGDQCAKRCYQEAIRRLRPTMKIIPYRPTLNTPVGEQPTALRIKSPKTRDKKRKDWQGHSTCSLIRWMGKAQFSVEQALKALTALALPAVEATVRIQLRKVQQNLALPVLTDKQASTLKGLRNG